MLENPSHQEQLNRKKIRFLSATSFFLGFLDAFFIYIISSYFVEVSGSENVGAFYLLAFAGVFALFLAIPTFLRRFGQVRLLLLVLLTLFGIAAFLSLRNPSWFGAGLLLVFLAANNVMWVVMDIILEGFSNDRVSGRVRGLYLTFLNGGLLVSPFLSTLTLQKFGYGGVFATLALGYAIVFAAVMLGLRDHNGKPVPEISILTAWRKVKQNKSLLKIYHISFVIEFFYALMIVYLPIYLTVYLGFQWEELGIIFTVMLVPFVILQYPLGVLADIHWGEKELLFLSLFLTAASTTMVGFIDSHSIIVWAALLFFTRIGVAAIEVLRDSYFYKQIDGRDADTIAFFRTARPVANILGALVASVFLIFFPIQGLFFVVVLVAVSGLFSAFTLRDSQSEREMALRPTLEG
ncbi:MAG: MFS transporter [Candidatus Moraniibacteriota bacterium]